MPLREITEHDIQVLNAAIEFDGKFKIRGVGVGELPPEVLESVGLTEGGLGLQIEAVPTDNQTLCIGLMCAAQPGVVDFDEFGAKVAEMLDEMWEKMKDEGADQTLMATKGPDDEV